MSRGTSTSDAGTAPRIQISSDQSNGLFVIDGLSNPSFSGGMFSPPGLDTGVPLTAFPPVQGGFSSLGGQAILFGPYGAKGGNGHGGGPGGGTSSGTLPPPPGGVSGSNFLINITWDSSVANAPSGFVSAFDNAVYYLESHFTNNVTININVGYGEVGGTNLSPGALGESESYLASYTYSQLYNAWNADTGGSSNNLYLSSSNPDGSATYWTTTAEAKALGLMSASSSVDGYVGFSSGNVFSYGSTTTSGTYDFYGVAIHELTEVMGRLLLAGQTLSGSGSSYPNSYALYDLFRYSSQGVQDMSTSMGGYFSANNGSTSSPTGAFNTTSGGDYGDWASSMTNDAFDAFATSGVTLGISQVDLTVLQALGWNPGTTAAGPVAPTGVNIAPDTSALGSVFSSTVGTAGGLAAGASLAAITEVGGVSGDTYTYKLGGTDAGSFGLGTSGNTLTVGSNSTTGASGVVGSSSGTVYALTVTANDTSNSTSSPAVPLDVVVGTGGSDNITVANVVGSSATSTPTFIYAGGGSDIINGSGMSGNLLFVGGGGADTMTGGSGVNEYLYGAISDSTVSAMDVITNFNAATDLIDLSGISKSLAYVGQIHGKKIAAGTVGWQQSNGTTYVYVNNSSSSETVTSANMGIQLNGNVSLSSGNFFL